jgi:hypothetical protein
MEKNLVVNPIKSEKGTYEGYDEVFDIVMDECDNIHKELVGEMYRYFIHHFRSDLHQRLIDRGLIEGVHFEEVELEFPIEPYLSDETESEMIGSVKVIY